jgi:hypothetical protein
VIILRLIGLILAPILFAGCSYLSALGSFLPGSDDGVNANAQIGKENTQAVVSNSEKIEAGDNASIEQVDATHANEVQGTQINNNGLEWWQWLFIGWMVPGPGAILCTEIQAWRQCRRKKESL